MNSEILIYIIKRILLMIPTLLGVLTLTFAVVQFVPGGPVEQLMLELKGKGDAAVGGESSGGGVTYEVVKGSMQSGLSKLKPCMALINPRLSAIS